MHYTKWSFPQQRNLNITSRDFTWSVNRVDCISPPYLPEKTWEYRGTTNFFLFFFFFFAVLYKELAHPWIWVSTWVMEPPSQGYWGKTACQSQLAGTELTCPVLGTARWHVGLPSFPRNLWLLRPWDSPGKNTGVGCHFLLQEIFLIQGLNPNLLHCR